MFTGLIETTGALAAAVSRGEGRALTIEAPEMAAALRVGESVAVDGCCLTVEAADARTFTAFASSETLTRTTLGRRSAGSEVNLERPLALGDRLGGHLVTGHVDALGRLERLERSGHTRLIEISFPPELAPLLVEKGSVALDGVSLTTFDVTRDRFRVAIIPETWTRTTLPGKRPGDAFNLEADLIGKYVARQAELRQSDPQSALTEDLLRSAGFIAS